MEIFDKSKWGPGPWQSEPDILEWVDEDTKLPCEVRRNSSGALCGYVSIPESHPYFGMGYDDLHFINVHGGLTYAGVAHRKSDIEKLAAPEDMEPKFQKFGFDCAHSGDYSPRSKEWDMHSRYGDSGEYRTLQYVQSECKDLATQFYGAQ